MLPTARLDDANNGSGLAKGKQVDAGFHEAHKESIVLGS